MTDLDLIGPIARATTRVVEMMAFQELRMGEPYTKRRGAASGDVTGVVGITGRRHAGSVAVSFTEPCIIGLVSSMLGEDISEVNPELLDAVGELTNMICGAARAEISGSGLELEAGLPAVICGRSHILSHASDVPVTVIPFSTEHGTFSVEACLEETAGEAGSESK